MRVPAHPNEAGIRTAYRAIRMAEAFHPDEPPCHNEEDRLVMRDGFLREIPW